MANALAYHIEVKHLLLKPWMSDCQDNKHSIAFQIEMSMALLNKFERQKFDKKFVRKCGMSVKAFVLCYLLSNIVASLLTPRLIFASNAEAQQLEQRGHGIRQNITLKNDTQNNFSQENDTQ